MLKTRLLFSRKNLLTNTIRTYLSTEYKNVMQTQLTFNDQTSKLKFGQTKKANIIDVTAFVNRIEKDEEHRDEIREKLQNLRLTEQATNELESVETAVINHFLNTDGFDDLLTIIRDRMNYGIFLDNFTSCYILDYLLEKNNYRGATQIVAESRNFDLDSQLFKALSFKACQKYLASLEILEHTKAEVTKSDTSEKKVRVKFLRNPLPIEEKTDNYLLGETILTLCNGTSDLTRSNIQLFAFLLQNDLPKLKTAFESNLSYICEDTLATIVRLLEKNNDSQIELIELLKTSKSKLNSQTLEQTIETLIRENLKTDENKLLDNQKLKLQKWQNNFEKRIADEIEAREKLLRQTNIQALEEDINKQKQLLWFFDTEEKLDLEILNKQPRYRKRWFGKKKKPRVIDHEYIPPDVVKKFN